MGFTFFRSAILLSVCLAVLSGAAGQVPSSEGVELGGSVKVNVRLVNVFFNVRDGRGQFVANLPKGEFTMLEDERQQSIRHFAADPNAELTLCMLVDTSPSQKKVLGYEQAVGKDFLNDVLQPRDRAMLADVDGWVRIVQDFTSDKKALEESLAKLQVSDPTPGLRDAHAGNAQFRGTILHDAIHILSEQRFEHEPGRKALIILTDGVDFGSQLDIEQAIKAAQLADVICYVLLVADSHYYLDHYYNDEARGQREMKQLAKETGGKVIKVGARIERLRAAFDLITNELRHHYSIGYVSSNPALDGSFRKLHIRTQHNYKIQVRLGYYATP